MIQNKYNFKVINGKLSLRALPDGFLSKNKVICIHCRCKLSHHTSTSSLKYYLLAKHTADAENPSPPHQRQDKKGQVFLYSTILTQGDSKGFTGE